MLDLFAFPAPICADHDRAARIYKRGAHHRAPKAVLCFRFCVHQISPLSLASHSGIVTVTVFPFSSISI